VFIQRDTSQIGKEEPRLLSVSEAPALPIEQIRKKVATPIDSYGWLDNAMDIPDEENFSFGE
jgi:hypothetical protein